MNCRVRNNPGLRSEPYLRFSHLQSADRQQTDWPGILYYEYYKHRKQEKQERKKQK